MAGVAYSGERSILAEMVRICFFLVAVMLTARLANAEPVISEFLAENDSGLRDDGGERSDWIEVYNPAAEPLELEGYFLTDSAQDLTKWRFPKLSVAPGGYVVVFASGRDAGDGPINPADEKRQRLRNAGLPEDFIERASLAQLDDILRQLEGRTIRSSRLGLAAPVLHASFKLSGDGEYLAIVKPDGKTLCHAFAPKYPEQTADVSYGLIKGSKADYGALLEPTPGEANQVKLEGFAPAVEFSENAGFFKSGFDLRLESASPGFEIHYTLNGDEPAPGYGMDYSKPIRVSESMIVRATAFKDGYRSPRPDTRTYLFLDVVVRQSPNGEPPAGWPVGNLNGQSLDYGMDPTIVGGVHSVEEVKAALQALPALSVVAPIKSLFGERDGIYVNAYSRGRDWERAASVELLNSDGTGGFQVDGGLRMRGGFSRQGSNPKHGFRMVFRKEYGDNKLKYPLFGAEGADEFDRIDFRSSMNYSWAMGGGSANTLLRDVWSRDTQRDMGQPYTRSRFYHLYLNGQYWGIYQTQERSEASFGETYLGGDKDDYDTIKTFGEVVDGNGEARARLLQAALRGFESDADYFAVQGMNPDGTRSAEHERLVDIDNVIDYMLITFYTGDKDGPGGTFSKGNNYFSIYNRKNPDGFKFFEHDSEHSLGLGMDDMTGSYMEAGGQVGRHSVSEREFNVHWLHTRLVANKHYLQRFSERVEKHLFADGALTPESSLTRLKARANTIDQAIIAHSARWGDAGGGQAKTREDWLAAVSKIEDFIKTRNETLLQQLHRRGWYTGLVAPRLNLSGGVVSSNFKVFVLEGEGAVYVTTDGTDPRGADGSPSATAVLAQIPKTERTSLLKSPSMARALVPLDGALGLHWTEPKFDDSSWIAGRTGIGYEAKSGYEDLIGIDLRDVMHSRATSAYLRTAFELRPPMMQDFDELNLKMRYDDGFVAYLNGKRIASANAPEEADWSSTATGDHADEAAKVFDGFSFEFTKDLLRSGTNVLAVHGMDGEASSDFIITPELEGIRYTGADPIRLKSGESTVRARSLKSGKWSPMTEVKVMVEES
ncbi:MAG: CotH kinase family protein [Verrucomicrobiae bacterium]|nr:CotH kinase family protein [Verrucomicrobiae bacterium]